MNALRRLTLLALAVALLAAAPAAAPAAATSSEQPGPATFTLRLPDLAPGYEFIDADGCSPRRLRDDAARLGLGAVADLPHRGCEVTFEPVWSSPGAPRAPAFVGSVAFVFQDTAGPQLALARPRALVTYVTASSRDDLDLVEPAPMIGDQTVVLHDVPGFTAYVVWRSRNVLGLVGAGFANGQGDSVAAAVRLATAQQARIATPTPLLPGDLDDLEVPLDDPRIDVPIAWVGRELDGGPRLPRVHLQEIEALRGSDHRYGLRTAMTYGPRRDVTAFQLMLLHPSAFDHPSIRRDLRDIRHDRCVRAERVKLADGSATLYARRRGCTARALDDEIALVRLPGVRVVVLPEYGCPDCVDVVTPWASDRGVRAVVRALRIREPSAQLPPG